MNGTNHPSELESLRLQVADLTRALAEREQSMQAQRHHFENTVRELREQSNLLRTIIVGTAAETGDQFFASLATHLTATLPVQYAVIGEVCDDRFKTIRTLAVAAGGALVDNFEYDLARTPCATALTQGFAYFDRDVQAMFPQFQRLADLRAESYCGAALRAKDGAVIGLLAVMDTNPLHHGDDVKSLLSVFAPRVAMELERRRTAQEHAEALADLQNVIETVPDVMFTLDLKGNLVKWNRRLGDVTGYSPEELLNKPALAFVPLEEQIRTAAAIQRAFVEGYAELDGQMLTKDHRTIPYHWTGALLKNSQGEPIGITGVGRDVSEKKQVEEELTRQRRHLVDAQALAHLGSWDWDIHTGEVQWSDEQFRIFGYEPGSVSVTHDTFLAALLPDDHERVLAAIHDALVGKQSYDIEYRIVRPNGEVRFVHARGDVYRDMKGYPFRMAGTVLDITERKRIEDALRASEERWHLAVRGSNDGIWDWNIQTGEVFFSSRWKAMRGFEDSEIRNDVDEWRSRIHPDDLERVLQSLDAYLAKQAQEFCQEYRVYRKDGSCMWIVDRGVALWADDGTPLRMAGSETDITARKGTEKALEESEERFALAVMGSTDILWDAHRLRGEPWYAPDTPIWWSPGVQELLGLAESEPFQTLEQWAVRLHPEDKERVFSQLTAHIDQKVPYDAEYRLRTNRGDYRWIRGRGQAIWDEDGEIRRMSGSCQDITDRKRADEALRKSEERYARATAVGKVGVWELDMTTGMYHADTNLKGLFGYVEDELSTDPDVWHSLVHPDDQAIALDHWQQIVSGESDNCNYELRMLKKDGTVIWTDVRGHAVRDHEGQVTHLFGATVDISERKQAEDALAQSECQLRTVLDALPVGVWFTDQSGKPILANPAAKQIWSGIRQVGIEDTANADGWWEAIGPSSELHRWALSHALTTGVSSLHESLDLECFDGTRKTIRNLAVPVRDEAGVVLGAIVVNEDITALRQAQETLRLTQFSVDHAVEGFFWISPDAKILRVNEAACRMLEYSQDELMAMTVPDIDPTLPPEVWPAHWGELKQKGSLTFESKHWSKTGRVLDTEITFKYLQHEGKEYNCAIMRDIGERKRAEAALRISEERYRSLYDDTPTMYFTLSTDGTVLSVNRFGANQLGYRVEELLGNSVLGILHKDDRDVAAACLSECLATPEQTRNWEFRKVRKDGCIIWVSETASVSQSSDGTLVVLVMCEDITERKQAEQGLKFFRTLLDHVDDSIEIIDPLSGRFLDGNAKAASNLGYTRDELLTLTVPDIDPMVTGPVFEDHMRQLRERTDPLVLDSIHRRKDGTTFPVEVSVQLIRLDKEYLVAIVRDITERKEAETSLRQSEERYRSLVDNAPIGIFLNEKGRFAYVNREMQRILNATSAEQLIGTSVFDRIAPEFHQVVTDRTRILIDDQQPAPSLDEQYVRLDGSRVDVAVTAIPSSVGGTPMMQVLVLDIAERKRVEGALRQRESDLRAAIDERERISQDLHDGILQSLFAVGLTLEASKSMMSPGSRKTAGRPLDQAIAQLNRVMRDIRNFIVGLGSDLLQGRDLQTALQHMLDLLTQNQTMRVALAVEARAAQSVSAEQSLHLFHVIQEAVSNCIRHGRAQEATVSLKMLKQGVRLSIRDNGRGFNPKATKGAGHGLANMAVRARKIGGRFTVMSKANQGTRIVLDLPKEASDVLH